MTTETSEHAAWGELEKRAAFWAEMSIRGAEQDVLDKAASQVADAIRVYRKARLRGPGVRQAAAKSRRS